MSAAPLPAAAVRATVLGADAASLRTAGEMLRAGKLVAFPTETVYGLGANALDEEAVLDIFRVKGRPLTDPLIVHIPTPDAAAALFETDDETAAVVAILAAAFWPGPLTLVARAASSLPLCVSAGTGFVGVRCPDHAVARALLAEAAVPVAAPSANRFGHVSPTSAQHVLDDLGSHALAVVDAPGCEVGIESTVARVDAASRELLVLRRGGVSELALAAALAKAGSAFVVRAKPRDAPAVVAEGVAAVAPGQLLTHYAPDRPTFLALLGPTGASLQSEGAADGLRLAECVVLDFGGKAEAVRARCAAYRDLSAKGSVLEAARELFDALRWAERAGAPADGGGGGGAGGEGARADPLKVLILDVLAERVEDEHVGALYDRMFRAASGRRVRMPEA